MQQRLDYSKAAPGTVQAMYKLEKFVEESGLERPLLELVKTRVSQINGCAFKQAGGLELRPTPKD